MPAARFRECRRSTRKLCKCIRPRAQPTGREGRAVGRTGVRRHREDAGAPCCPRRGHGYSQPPHMHACHRQTDTTQTSHTPQTDNTHNEHPMYTTHDTTSTHNTNHTHDRHNGHAHNIHWAHTQHVTGIHSKHNRRAHTTSTHHTQQTHSTHGHTWWWSTLTQKERKCFCATDTRTVCSRSPARDHEVLGTDLSLLCTSWLCDPRQVS